MPLCWDDPQAWKEWNRFNQLSRANPDEALDHFCTDCSAEFKQLSVDAGRCAYPEVKFVRIIERQVDPATGRRHVVLTDAQKGVR